MLRHVRNLSAIALVIFSAESATAQLKIAGLFSMVARNQDASIESNKTNLGITPYDAVYGRLFMDAKVSDRLSAFVQWFAHSYDGAFFYGAYVRYDHTPNLHLEAGLIPTPVGLWGQRTYADKNPLISVPAIYQYKTSLDPWGELQISNASILEKRGQHGLAPVLYDFCWNTGVHAYASHGQFDFGLALLNGSLGVPQRDVVYSRPGGALHLNWVPSPYVTVGGWVSDAPWISPHFESQLPAGKVVEDYSQLTSGALLQTSAGHAELHAEIIFNRYEHPFLGDLENIGGYADIKYSFATRWWGAVRLDALSFSELQEPDGNGEKWDYPLTRIELGLGRRLSERAMLKGVAQVIRYSDAPSELDGEVFALQLTVEL
jgi:hypothetical protein